MRTFDTGATRDNDETKLDYEGCLSPVVLERFAQFMHEHRIQADGALRAADNWQKGIPKSVYMASLLRHVMDIWVHHRFPFPTTPGTQKAREDALCAIIFNAMGYLFEEIVRDEGAT
jgi:hypothetical protein